MEELHVLSLIVPAGWNQCWWIVAAQQDHKLTLSHRKIRLWSNYIHTYTQSVVMCTHICKGRTLLNTLKCFMLLSSNNILRDFSQLRQKESFGFLLLQILCLWLGFCIQHIRFVGIVVLFKCVILYFGVTRNP